MKRYRLTVTWDVFKRQEEGDIGANVGGLTVTWDVFKHMSLSYMFKNLPD